MTDTPNTHTASDAGLSEAVTHFGDPCIHCGTAHDSVEPGPCAGTGKRKVVGWASLGVRWDGYESFRYRTSDGVLHESVSHISNHAPYYHFGLSDDLINPPPYDRALSAQPQATEASSDGR